MGTSDCRLNYYYSRLGKTEKIVYRIIADAARLGKTQILLPVSDTIEAYDWNCVIAAVIDDNPDIFHLDTTNIRLSQTDNEINLSFARIYTEEEHIKIKQLLKKRVAYLLNQTDQYEDEFDKITYLHDYLAENVTYFYDMSNLRSIQESHSIIGTLLNSSSVCDGYARAFKYLCDIQNIPCIVINGQVQVDGQLHPHSWNLICFHNIRYHVDISRDNQKSPRHFENNNTFLLTDDICAADHKWDYHYYASALSK